MWGTLDNNFSKWLRGYAGKDILSKPESTALAIKNNKLLDLETYKLFLEQWFKKYNSDIHTGEGMEGLSPFEVWQASLESNIKLADTETLTYMRLVFMNDKRSITSGGKIRARNTVYIAPELIAYIGNKVSVGLDPHNLDKAYIFYEGKLLCIAENEIKADYTNTPKTQKAFRQQAKSKCAFKKLNKRAIEIKKTESAVLLSEKTKVIESQDIQVIEKEEVFDRYGYLDK